MPNMLFASVILFLLAHLWCGHTASSHQFPPKIRWPITCKCHLLPSNKLICQRGYFPQSFVEKQELVWCLCKMHYKGKKQKHHPKLQKLCKNLLLTQISIPLPLT
ncbi:hypothetical protein GN956_G14861 [Arapaima gigas]